MNETSKTAAENLVRLLITAIGDNNGREGLINTPSRVVRSWKELFAGYKIDPEKIVTTFSTVANVDEIIVLRNIEFYSTCEHHMLPFMGYGHVAYMPNKKIIGISKLARVLDAYARRLQIQERIGEQVTMCLEKTLQPKAAACILVAKHQCMACRGVRKQNSEMVTSSLTNLFREPQVKQELFALIGSL